MIIASNLEEAISLSYKNINKEIHYPGGAISYVDKLPTNTINKNEGVSPTWSEAI